LQPVLEGIIKTIDLKHQYSKSESVSEAVSILNKTDASIHLKGLRGSLTSIVLSSIFKKYRKDLLLVANDFDDAAYLLNDLQSLLREDELMYFPASFKRPYHYEEIDNANVLRRSETLTKLSDSQEEDHFCIVTYPEALAERVVSKKTFIDNTVSIPVNTAINLDQLKVDLLSMGFEQTDFVFEAGQFAIRGGIVDVFSYSSPLPFRLELFGDDVDSIRLFDPGSQLSKDVLEKIEIVPNIEQQVVQEEYQSFFDFLDLGTVIAYRDLKLSEEIVEKSFLKCLEEFQNIADKETPAIIPDPERKFLKKEDYRNQTKKFRSVEFGNRFSQGASAEIQFESAPQPTFKKKFDLLATNLHEYALLGYDLMVASDSEAQINRLQSIFLELDSSIEVQALPYSLHEGFVDHQSKVVCYTDHQIFERHHRFKIKEKYSKAKAITLRELQALQPGDFVTHVDYGVGRFAGLEKIDANGRNQEAVRLIYRDNDLLYVSIHSLHKITKYSGKEGAVPQISKLGSPEWETKKKRVKKKVIDIATDLINLYAKRKNAKGIHFGEDTFLQAELESSFLYEDTPDQSKATNDVKLDMQQSYPMDRLVCGDVGFGKTEVAIRAAFKAVDNQKQVAVLVPTTILAMQHYRTFSDRLEDMPVTIEYINRFKSSREIREILKRVEEGKVDILIGTHRIVNKDVKFKQLGLLVIDEEQKFGVRVKEKLKEFKVNVDVLTLTATPIPRTLHFSLMGARDLSIISTPPPNRQPVTTILNEFNEEVLRDAISDELRRGGQVFFVHNRINDIDEIGNIILRLVPEARIIVAHGQMKGHLLEDNMMKFISGEADILVSTNIIESGLDIPNANTIIINHSHMFGLSDLHQMRGRVGRSNRKAYCYLLTPPLSTLSSDARKRLKTLEEFTELGDGFKVAMRDLDIRGAGNLLGAEQSGFITDLGFDMYHKILDEAVQELKETQFKELFEKDLAEGAEVGAKDCNVETDLQILIPEDYVSNISERLRLYNELDVIDNDKDLEEFRSSLTDRFGTIPPEAEELINSVRLRWRAQRLGLEKLTLKNGNLKGYFLSGDNQAFYNSDSFGKVLKYIQSNPAQCRMQDVKGRPILTIKDVASVDAAHHLFDAIAA